MKFSCRKHKSSPVWKNRIQRESRGEKVVKINRFFSKLERPVWVLLSGILFTHFGYYMILPYLSVILATQRGLSLTQTGMVLGAGSISYLTGSLIGGTLSDRIGRRTTMVTGLLIRAVGLAGFAFFWTLPLLFATAIATGIGGGLYTPPAKAGIAAYASGENKSTAFSYRGIAANIGTMGGPLLGTLLIVNSPTAMFLLATSIYIALAVSHILLLTPECETGECPQPTKNGMLQVVADIPYLIFSFVTVLIWVVYTQFTLAIPLRAAQILPTAQSVGMLWTITSILVIFLQAPLTRFISNRMHPLYILGTGVFIMAAGLGSVMFSSTFYHLIVSAVIFTVGEMLIMPTVDSIVSELAKPQLLGSYFGIAALVWGLGEAVGNMGGGRLMDFAARKAVPSLPWIVFFLFGTSIAGFTFLLKTWNRLASPISGTLAERNKTTFSPLLTASDRENLHHCFAFRSKIKNP